MTQLSYPFSYSCFALRQYLGFDPLFQLYASSSPSEAATQGRKCLRSVQDSNVCALRSVRLVILNLILLRNLR